MLLRRVLLFALVLCSAAPSFAQDDDLLAPLTPQSSPKSKSKPAKTRKPPAAKGKKPTKVAEPAEDTDLLAPLVKKTELLVKFSGALRGTRLFVDDKEVGPVSRTPVEVEPGEHTIVVRKMGYRDYSRRLTLKEGEVTELNVALEATAAFVSVKADADDVRVSINGEDKGVAPLDSVMVPAGALEIAARREGFRTETQRIAVRAGKDYTIDFKMRPEAVAATDQPRAPNLTPAVPAPSPLQPLPPEVATSKPLTSRWYFWAGVGAVVAGAAVGAVMVANSGPPTPDAVCSGPCDAVINAGRPAPVGVSF
ncbi:PEGA domain-containing protein [Melittangium boletus]|uniref:PEGA domain-containing protein n=1 Tax=Melittangium boletus TaxID=83453 RepID=UPI003DA46EE9